MKRNITRNRAAADVRHKILRKMREVLRRHPEMGANKAWAELIIYIKMMANRSSKRSGGLGKK